MSKKSRKLIRSGPETPVDDVPEQEDVPEEKQWDFFFLPDADTQPMDERELNDLMKLWRHGRATRSIWQALSDGYVVLFAVVMLGAMLVNVIIKAQAGMVGCVAESCAMGRLFLPTATVVACYALTLMIAGLFGPVLASAAEGFWLMDAPISRRRLLRRRLALPVVVAAVVAMLLVALVAALSGMTVVEIVLWAVAAAAGSAALMSLAAIEQERERTRWVRVLQAFFTAVAVVVLIGVVAIAAGWLPAAVLSMSVASAAVAGLAALAVVGFVVWLIVALRRMENIRRARLLSGGSLVAGMQGAMFALDFGLIRDILVERRAVAKGHVRPTKGRGLGMNALIWRDLERLKRDPKPLIGLALALFVCYAADALRMSVLNPFISGVALMAALVPFLGSMRVLSRTGGLARAFPFTTGQLRTSLMAIPAVLAVVWGVASMPAFIGIDQSGADRSLYDAEGAALVTVLAGLLGAVRWVTAKKVDFNVPMMSTATGAMPPTLLFNLFRGIDMAALITAPLILGAPLWASLALALIVFVVLRGTFNMDDMKAQQEEQQRQLREARAGAGGASGGAKTKVPRPQVRSNTR